MSVIDEVITNNKTNDRKITVVYNDVKTSVPDEIKNLKKSLDSSNKYEVSLDYDDKGYVSTITIEDIESSTNVDDIEGTIKNQLSEFEIRSFNNNFEMYYGTKYGNQVVRLLDKITSNNTKNTNQLVTLLYKNVNTTNIDEIRNLKSSFGDWTKYEVWFDYNDDGLIYQVHIEEK